MKKVNTLILIALTTLFVTSCTVEKRLYNKGLHVQWGTKYKTDKKEKVQAESVASTNFNEIESEENALAPSIESRSAGSFSPSEDEIVDVSANDIPYEAEGAHSERTFTSQSTSNIQNSTLVESANPISEVMKTSSDKTEKNRTNHKQSADAESGSKSQIVAFILVLLLGLLGIHRFYLGYPGIGILMILTLGCFGILALVDLIRILLGDLKPKHGDYYQKF